MDLFKDITGQENIRMSLSSAVLNNKLHHAYLFTGPSGTGREAVALELIKIINCTGDTHGYCGECRSCRELYSFSSDDLLYIFPDIIKKSDSEKAERQKNTMIIKELKEKSALKGYHKFSFKKGRFITLDQISGIKNFSRYNSISGSKKFIIINPAELMNKEAQNSLLKILEEPPADHFFILISENPSFIVDTIKSRSLNIDFPPLSNSDLKKFALENYPEHTEEEINDAVSGAFGSIDNLRKLLSDEDSVIDRLSDKFTKLLTATLPPETIKTADEIIEELKVLSDDDISLILKQTGLSLVDTVYGKEMKFSLDSRSRILNDLDRFMYMFKRNINPRLIIINLYFNFREELKKWKRKKIMT